MRAKIGLGMVFGFAALMGGTFGCKTMVTIRGVQPAPVGLGATKQIMVFHSEGRRSARETLIAKLIAKARSGGYFQVTDRGEEGATVKIAGMTATVEGGKGGLEAGQVGARIDVLEWEAAKDTIDKQYRETVGTGKGKKTVTKTKSVKVVNGSVLLGVTLFGVSGKAYFAEKEFKGTSQLEGSDSDAAIDAAADNVVGEILAQITPMPYQQQVELDTDDAGQETIIDIAKKGAIQEAVDKMKAYVEANPSNAAAAYNLAVFVEATGDYTTALAYYEKALSLGNKPLYSDARAACAKRVADQDALTK